MPYGESTWESNPPKKLLTPHTGFEDQEAHQHPFAPIMKIILIKRDFVNLFMHFKPANIPLEIACSIKIVQLFSSLLSLLSLFNV